jgi:hypothetical protein
MSLLDDQTSLWSPQYDDVAEDVLPVQTAIEPQYDVREFGAGNLIGPMRTAPTSDLARAAWYDGADVTDDPGLLEQQPVRGGNRQTVHTRETEALEAFYATIYLAAGGRHALEEDYQRSNATIYNAGPGVLYIAAQRGPHAGGSNTFPIPSGGTFNDMKHTHAIYMVADSNGCTVSTSIERFRF